MAACQARSHDVTEARPVALWVTDERNYWVLSRRGHARADLAGSASTEPGLLQIIDGGAEATAPIGAGPWR